MQKNDDWRDPENSTRNYYGGGRTAPWRGNFRMATPQEKMGTGNFLLQESACTHFHIWGTGTIF